MQRLVVALAGTLALGACAYDEPKDRCDGPCAIYSIDRPLASPGNVITLEGNFDRNMVVQFPGAATTVPLDSHGPHRVTVTVPNDATSGGLVALGSPGSTEPFAFRSLSFRPELQAFRSAYEQTDVGRFLGTSSQFQRTGGAAVVAGGRVYMIGGSLASGAPSATIDSMLVNADDTLGDPTSNVALLTTARSRHASLAIGPYIYAIGGAAAGGATDSVEGTQLDEMQQLGTFGPVPGDVKLTVPREGLAAAVIGNYAYVVGGKNDKGDLPTLERAPIYEQGLLGTFEAISGVELLTRRSGHSLAIVANYLYVIGGNDGGTPLDSIERLELEPNGYISAPTVVGRLATARTNHTSVIVGDSIYVIGGRGPTGVVADVERIPIGDTLVPTPAEPLHGKRSGAMLVSSGNHVYLLGGSDENGVPITTFERASIIGHTTLLPSDRVTLENFNAVSAVQLRTPRSSPTTLVLGNSLYVIGGANMTGPLKTIEKATINADGTLGEFQVAQVSLNTARMAHASFVYNNDFFVLGGRTSIVDFSTYTQSVERAHIGADGTLGPFETLGFTLDVPRGYFKVAVIGRTLYVLGGVSDGGASAPTYLATVKSTPVDPSTGILAPLATHSTLFDARAVHTSLVLSTFAYLYGGKSTNTTFLAGASAFITADGTVNAGWAAVAQNPSNREGGVLVAVGDAIFAIGGVSNSGFEPTQRSTATAEDDLSSFSMPASGSLEKQRYGHAAVTIGNQVYVLGGVDASSLLDSLEVSTIR